MPCPKTQHRNNIPILRGEKHDISLKILHQAEFETARQIVTLAKLRDPTIARCPSISLGAGSSILVIHMYITIVLCKWFAPDILLTDLSFLENTF